MQELEKLILSAWDNRELLKDKKVVDAINEVVKLVNNGELRVANLNSQNKWITNEWIKKGIILYFPLRQMEVQEVGIFEFHDKMQLKNNYKELGVRVVPPAVARYGAYIAPGTILMPSYVNIGAYIDSGTMVDTWATVGSCAQIGKDVHLSGGVGIGGVLEPAQASPVIIEDGAFIGSRCIVVEGAHIAKRAVLGAGVTITGSSKIIDVTGPEPIQYIGYVPENSVVIPGTINKEFPAGTFGVPVALIIGKRKASTDLKTSLNEALRENNVTV
jgi:2,3,4,5-tetrahydropyridine-2-carboxylate N-succinyltransferase